MASPARSDRGTEGRSSKKLTLVYRPLDQLKVDSNNPRIHTQLQIKQIANSIRVFGSIVPILIDSNSRVLAGHGRLEAAKLLGLKDFPTISVEHLTEAQARAFGIADNKLTENSQWDERLLGEQLKILSEAQIDFDLETIGFATAEIDLLIEGVDSPAEDESESVDELPEEAGLPAVAKPADLWLLGRNRLYCGNSLERNSYAKLMEKRRAEVVFIDPPFNVRIDGNVCGKGRIHHREFAMASGEMSEEQFVAFLTTSMRLLIEFSVPGSVHYVCMDWRHARELLDAAHRVYDSLLNLCIWAKNNGGMGSFYRSQHELIFVFRNGKQGHRNNIQLGKFGRNRTNLWSYPGVNTLSKSSEEGNLLALHPTTKPVSLVADAILDSSARGDIVLDAFLGSGTTLLAAERTGRVAYGIELDALYVDTAIRRWQKFTGSTAKHAVSGRSFNELEQEVASGSTK